MSAINFPWLTRNPFKFAAVVAAFVLGISFPLLAVASNSKYPYLAALPIQFVIGMGALFLIVSLTMRALTRRLRTRIAKTSAGATGYLADCLIVKGFLQMLGVVEVRDGSLFLWPVFGLPVELPIADIQSVDESNRFNGETLFGSARGFWFRPHQFAGWVLRWKSLNCSGQRSHPPLSHELFSFY